MKKLFKYTAENISRSGAIKFVKALEADNIEVEHALMDPVFEHQFIMFVTCTDAEATAIKNRVWALNNGLYCEMYVADATELEEYI